MSPLQWVLLCVLFTLYLLLGGGVFMYFEQYREIEKKEEISVLRKDIREILLQLDNDFYHNDTTSEVINALRIAKEGVLHRISTVCELSEGLLVPENESAPAPPGEDKNERLKWNFYNSVFFAFTVVTTIGYGHLSPSTNWSKWFVMFYSLIGIPITTMLLSALGDYFSSRLTRVHKKSKDKKHKNKWSFMLKIMFYLIPGIIVFIIFPAGIFVLIESWSFLDAIYFSFVTLSTIGFGDYVAGMGIGHTVWMSIYKAVIIIWITFGLGYFIMILGFISKALTHKKVRVVIEKRLNNTREKLSRDIDYMRRVVNELYLMKINPVYEVDQDEVEYFKAKAKRTQSQPCVSFEKRYSSLPRLGNLPAIIPPLFSNSLDGSGNNNNEEIAPKLIRRSSDSDLSNINRDKTFESAVRNFVTPDELLVTVVNALSGNVMHDVMEAVDELNHYETAIGEEGEDIYKHPKNLDISRISEEGFGFEDVPSWDLGTLSESDEEVLIEDDVDEDACNKLEQVVIHGESNVEKCRQNSSIMERVTGAIRKISSGNKSPQDGPSRKISRNESDRKKKISRTESFERRLSVRKPSKFLNPLANCPSAVEDKSNNESNMRKISQESHSSRTSNHSMRSTRNPIEDPKETHMPSNARASSKISLETTSLAEFLKALDNVHSRLNAKISTSSMGSNPSHLYDDLPGHGFSNGYLTTARSRRISTEVPQDRRRKMGMVHPDFAFVNYGFNGPESDTGDNPIKEKEPPNRKK